MKIDENNATVIGITGTIGSGKSTVGQILQESGIPVIDTDKIVHGLLDTDAETKKNIKKHFPSAIKPAESGDHEQIDRKQLAKIIFKDQEAKTTLEIILHPRVRQICRQRINELAATNKVIAVLVPLLFEANLQSQYDQVWTIIAEEPILRQRLMKRDGFSAQEIDLRLAGQMSQQEKAQSADKVLDNSGDENQLREQVMQLLKQLQNK